jgi:hypothetical protein
LSCYASLGGVVFFINRFDVNESLQECLALRRLRFLQVLLLVQE